VEQNLFEGDSTTSSRRLISTGVLARFIVDTGSQIFNPFLPIVAAGLKTNVVTLGWLVSLRSAMGLLAPVFGSLADRRGYRPVMCFGLVFCSIGSLIVGISGNLMLAAIGMLFWGIGIAAFVPTLHAYLSSQLPYARRARGIGILEYSWALAGIVGLFSMGLLISVSSWRAPFLVISFGLVVMAFVVQKLPAVETRKKASTVGGSKNFLDFFRLGSNSVSAYATIVSGACFGFAAMQVFIAHGEWLSREYGIGAAGLGTIAMLLGCTDLCGSVSVSLFVDRIGKRQSVLLGCVGAFFGYLLMPILNVNLYLAVLGIAIARTCFEFAIVSNIALLSEQVPDQRGKVMTLGSAGTLIGFTFAGPAGPWLYTDYGVQGLSLTSAMMTALAIAICWSCVREG